MEGWRDESRNKEMRERREIRDRLIYEFLFLNRDVFRDFTEMSQSGALSHTHTHRNRLTQQTHETCNSATSHSVGKNS